MAYNVRLFGYSGIEQIEQNLPKQFTADTVFVPTEPCLWSEVISVPEGTGAAVTSTVVALVPDHTRVCFIEVPDGKAVRYEVQPQGPTGGGARVAGTASRRLSGIQPVKWNAGFTISLTDAAFYT
jgi:hypothetical protein